MFQQYAAKYVGISRGIPLSNTNQLWGLAWGFWCLASCVATDMRLYAQVIGGSLLMAAGAGAIALSSVTHREHGRWHEAAHREGERYGVSAEYVQAGLAGRRCQQCEFTGSARERGLIGRIVAIASAVFVGLATCKPGSEYLP